MRAHGIILISVTKGKKEDGGEIYITSTRDRSARLLPVSSAREISFGLSAEAINVNGATGSRTKVQVPALEADAVIAIF